MAQLKRLEGLADYESTWQAMKTFTENRLPDTENQIWQVEHPPVYTLGQAGKPEHVLNPGKIPVVRCNRGGQVTYHGPGQVVIYPLINLHRANMFVKEYVTALEDAIIHTLNDYGISQACRKDGAPGVYVPMENGELAKIAALGVKVSRGCTYHGLAINVDMDLSPFDGINPCGYAQLKTVDMKTVGVQASWQEVADKVSGYLMDVFA
ncbi:octanoyltransferase [Advenella faeciporci]|uniref:Octanoyltransferase n=1 Tax=Advenella faeciporci TaxID=797535 RepID=A0A918JM61_9BURK|nr:lipoyl(octanoyl) transferase LipB [Advenella faeciporci]GGW84988.1 octanoyltransferase [Advenella faeciporci]